MTAEHRHHLSGSLLLALSLATSAGFVDAFVYTRVTPVFVANMSGNLVRLGISSGLHDWREFGAGSLAVASFLIGVVAATASIDARVRVSKPPLPRRLLNVESILLVALTAVLVAKHVTYSASTAPIDYLVLWIGATAMGVQAVAIRRVGQVAVSTTYGTGALVRLGEKLTLAILKAPRPDGVRRRSSIIVLGSILVSYVLGAFVATSVPDQPWLLLVPALVPLAGETLIDSALRRRAPGTPDDSPDDRQQRIHAGLDQ